MKKKFKLSEFGREFNIECPEYSKCLKQCPSSKNLLLNEDYDKLIEFCVSSKYSACSIYLSVKEKAA